MRSNAPWIELISPITGDALRREGDALVSSKRDEHFPIIDGIPRFVPNDDYSTSFGLQWNRYRLTQLDSYTGCPISRDRLARIAGALSIFKDQSVLEAGCGAGRFTEIMLAAGAKVCAVDLSSAVDANYQTFKDNPDHFVCQADILQLPFRESSFDVVVCIGVIQHTRNPDETIATLCRMVRPGGCLLMDHYSPAYPMSWSRRFLRGLLLKRSPRFAMDFCRTMVRILWPVHRFVWLLHTRGWMTWFRRKWVTFSPVVDYHDSYGKLGSELLYEWALLDTHDLLTDRFKHLRSKEEIEATLFACEMRDVEVWYGGNGVEARARKPQ